MTSLDGSRLVAVPSSSAVKITNKSDSSLDRLQR